MIDPLAIRFAPTGTGGFREVFVFSARSADGNCGFILRHVLLRQVGQRNITVQNVLVCEDRRTGAVLCTHEQEDVAPAGLKNMLRSGRWDRLSHNFASGSFFEITATRLRGKMHTRLGSSSWDISLHDPGEAFFPFSRERFYSLPWPPVKTLTPMSRQGFSGRLSCAGTVLSGEFLGGSRHVWGAGRLREYAGAGCNRFAGGEDAFFSGLSARLPLLGDWVATPFLSVATLRLGKEVHAFNTLAQAPRQVLHALDNYRWLATFSNAGHRLEVTVDGANPRVEPWLALQETCPDGHRMVTKSTLFAAGRLRLYEKGSDRPLAELASDGFELETLRPDSVAVGDKLLGKA